MGLYYAFKRLVWSNTHKKSCTICFKNFKVCLPIFGALGVKRLTKRLVETKPSNIFAEVNNKASKLMC